MKPIRQLKYGTIFHHPDTEDALNEGYDTRMQKIGRDLAVELKGGFRRSVNGSDEVIIDGFTKVHLDTITEVERVALTLLAKAHADHPCVRAWVGELVRNPDEYRGVDDYCLDENPIDLNTLEDNGYARPVEFSRFGEETLGLKLVDCKGTKDWNKRYGPPNKKEQYMHKEHDRAIYLLASAVTEYRRRGRPDGDQAHTIMGLGSPLLNVTTSLAAAIVEYHEAEVCRAWDRSERGW